eukprot:SAG11_NODE_708_length_7648_cov_3.486687_6_plen_272_part_00
MKPGFKLRLYRLPQTMKIGLQVGDIGAYATTNGGTPPCQVAWERLGIKYWVHWAEVEIIEPRHAVGSGELELGGTPADNLFRQEIVQMRRIRQLADGESATSLRRKDKFCGHFCEGGVEAERTLVKQQLLPRWGQLNYMLQRPVERLFDGERDLAVLTRGLDPGSHRLMTLIYHAEDGCFDKAVRASFAETQLGGAVNDPTSDALDGSRLDTFFEKHIVSIRRIRQLADPDTALVDPDTGLAVQPRFNQVSAARIEFAPGSENTYQIQCIE